MKNELIKKKRYSHLEIGNIYFWTATINKWQNLLIKDNYKDIIISSLDFLSIKKKIEIYVFVIMPNHIHLIWKMLGMNGKESPHTSFLKFTSHEFKKLLSNDDLALLKNYRVNAKNKNYEFWQRDSMAIHLYTESVAYQKMDYIHDNPVSGRWQLANDPCQYRYSTARYYELGIIDYLFIKDLRNEF